MINFLSPILDPRVYCDKSSMDGYEAQNLISRNYRERASGFLAYITIKPPIDLDFEFICSLDIHYIVIKSTVGNNKSSGIEVFVKRSTNFVPIGKSVYDEDGVVFLSRTLYDKNKLPPNLPKDYHICFLRSGHISCNTSTIKIRIIRSGKFVPCLGSVEVWGKVSKHCSEETKRIVEKRFESSQLDSSSLLTSLIKDQTGAKNDGTDHVSCDGIPDDFKDELTYELMTVPMTLPSGKTVDISTLDKHIASEKQFGRKPGDPFTGLKFSNISKPILNVSLKSRIDMFVLKNSSKPQFLNIARTTGKKEKSRSDDSCGNEIKKIKLDDGDEIVLDTSKLKFRQFKETVMKCCYECRSCEILFNLPCNHIYCRKCLGQMGENLKCKCCNKCFSRSNVERCHL